MAQNSINELYRKWRETEGHDPDAAHDALAEMLPQVEKYVGKMVDKAFPPNGALSELVREESKDSINAILWKALRNAKASDPGMDRWDTFSAYLANQIRTVMNRKLRDHTREMRGGPLTQPGGRRNTVSLNAILMGDNCDHTTTLPGRGSSPVDEAAASELSQRLAERLRAYIRDNPCTGLDDLRMKDAQSKDFARKEIGMRIPSMPISPMSVTIRIAKVDKVLAPLLSRYKRESGEARDADAAVTHALEGVIKGHGGTVVRAGARAGNGRPRALPALVIGPRRHTLPEDDSGRFR